MGLERSDLFKKRADTTAPFSPEASQREGWGVHVARGRADHVSAGAMAGPLGRELQMAGKGLPGQHCEVRWEDCG